MTICRHSFLTGLDGISFLIVSIRDIYEKTVWSNTQLGTVANDDATMVKENLQQVTVTVFDN